MVPEPPANMHCVTDGRAEPRGPGRTAAIAERASRSRINRSGEGVGVDEGASGLGLASGLPWPLLAGPCLLLLTVLTKIENNTVNTTIHPCAPRCPHPRPACECAAHEMAASRAQPVVPPASARATP